MLKAKRGITLFVVCLFALSVILPINGFGASKKELVVWAYLTEAEGKALQPIANSWAKDNGYSVKVFVNLSGNYQGFLTAAKSGKGPDIVFGIPHDQLGSFCKAGQVEPLPANLINKKAYVSMSLDAVSFGGKLYGIPIAMETYALFYNTSKIKKAPTTMSEFLSLAKKYGFMYDVNNFYYSFAFIAQQGGYVFKNKGGTLDPNDIGLATPGAVRGLTLIRDFVQKYKFMPKDIKGDIAKGNFQNGKIGLYIGGPWDVEGFEEAKVPFSVVPLPKTDNGKVTPSFVGIQTAFVSAKSKNKVAAFQLLKYLSENSALKLFEVGHRIPALNSALNNPMVKADKVMIAFAEQAKNGIPMPNIPEMVSVWVPAANMLSLITAGKVTPQKGAEEMVKQIKQGIAQQQ